MAVQLLSLIMMKKEKENINERYLQKLEKHLENSQASAKYSSDRFDILIVAISSSALIVTIGFVKNLIGDSNSVDTTLLKTSWLLFVMTIIVNLTSQLSAFYSHKYDYKVTRNLIRIERKKNVIGNQKLFEKICSKLNWTTQALNIISFITLFAAIIVMVLFYSKNI